MIFQLFSKDVCVGYECLVHHSTYCQSLASIQLQRSNYERGVSLYYWAGHDLCSYCTCKGIEILS